MDEKEEKQLSFNEALSYAKGGAEDFKLKLKEYKYDFDTLDDNGKSILIHLCEIKNSPSEVVWLILEFFGDPNIKDSLGNSALHYAFEYENKPIILTLLLFGASFECLNNLEKKPIDVSKFTKDEFDPIIEKINKYKINFLQLNRKRRKNLKKIFDEIDNDQSKTIGEHKLKCFNEWFNEESEDDAREDARVFLDEAKLFKSDEILWEEFVISMSRICFNYGLTKIDEIISKFKDVMSKNKKKNQDMY